MESFWSSMQVELLDRQRWRTILERAIAIADYIEHFYNPVRRHSALGYLTCDLVATRRSTLPISLYRRDYEAPRGRTAP